ncbi:hypothetical protein [Rhodoferax sp.]|uniref:hypothetical protein n=1 Tax=Rhodoferax sp. TaxID=50421 RepID=UPI0028525A76|nr:hypothetical protein [Rhodoferax sp.]
MMIVLSLLILATLLLSFYSVDQLTAGAVQWLSGADGLVLLVAVAVLVVWLVWRKRRAAACAPTDVPRES